MPLTSKISVGQCSLKRDKGRHITVCRQTGNHFFPLKPHVLQADKNALVASVVSDSLRPRGDKGGKLLPERPYLSVRLARQREQTCDCQGRGGVGQDGFGGVWGLAAANYRIQGG